MAAYTTPNDLRAELDVDAVALPDEKADRLIADACDAVDHVLGAWTPDEFGRKIQEDNVEAWQWTMLGRATVKAAARLYANPDAFTEQQFETVKGPEFEQTGPKKTGATAILGLDVVNLLAGTLLIVRSGFSS